MCTRSVGGRGRVRWCTKVCVVGSRKGMLCVLSEQAGLASTSYAPKSHFEAGKVHAPQARSEELTWQNPEPNADRCR